MRDPTPPRLKTTDPPLEVGPGGIGTGAVGEAGFAFGARVGVAGFFGVLALRHSAFHFT
ncbi:hypothetical protein GCM10010307_61150 [Streptomyces vastus]|uniref:Uncharacterized protein n=1 Tax=Streptomyces vastus TaxID=285451 RepID=A0ABN3RFF8_9ACTN